MPRLVEQKQQQKYHTHRFNEQKSRARAPILCDSAWGFFIDRVANANGCIQF